MQQISQILKNQCIAAQQEHLNSAKAGRDFYKFVCNQSKETLETHRTETLLNHKSRTAPTLAGPVHYSFDYAQQVHIPSNPVELGPIYFKTPRKCDIFGVMCKERSQQVNFLIDVCLLLLGKAPTPPSAMYITF